MADTHARGRASAAFEAMGPTQGGNLVCVTAKYSLTAAPSANDVFQMLKIPAGATIIDGYIVASGALGFAYQVGDGDSNARFVATYTVSASTTGTTKSFIRTVLPHTYTSADTIDVKAIVIAASTASAFSLTVWYLADGQDNTTTSHLNK